MPAVSVIVPTFGRPLLLARALQAIQQQTFTDFEVIVLDDGSDEAVKAAYDPLRASLDPRFRWFELPPRTTRLSNLSVARNVAFSHASGDFVGFCDDDDIWTDPDHLKAAIGILRRHPPADFYFADQIGVRAGETTISRWQPGLVRDLSPADQVEKDVYAVPRNIFVRHWTPHTNTMLLARPLVELVGAFWPYTPIEQDVDFIMRAADRARAILFRDAVVARHEIPDRSKQANSSTRVTRLQRQMYRIAIANHLQTVTQSAEVRRFAYDLERYANLHIAEQCLADANPTALHFAWKGLLMRPSPSAGWLCLRAMLRRSRPPSTAQGITGGG